MRQEFNSLSLGIGIASPEQLRESKSECRNSILYRLSRVYTAYVPATAGAVRRAWQNFHPAILLALPALWLCYLISHHPHSHEKDNGAGLDSPITVMGYIQEIELLDDNASALLASYRHLPLFLPKFRFQHNHTFIVRFYKNQH